jgi:hypothetical protein
MEYDCGYNSNLSSNDGYYKMCSESRNIRLPIDERKCASSSCGSTEDALREIPLGKIFVEAKSVSSSCSSASSKSSYKSCNNTKCHSSEKCRERKSYNPSSISFKSTIVPVTCLKSKYNNCDNMVEFRMKRKNKIITFQWEPFTGSVGCNGISHIYINQSISNLPPYPISFPIVISYKGERRVTMLQIDPFERLGVFRFYFDVNGSSDKINIGDSFTIYGGCVSWILD